MTDIRVDSPLARSHPRTLGWYSSAALAMGGSNQSLFLIAALFVGQGAIPGQGSAAVPLLIVGVLLSWAAAPGWTELVLMSPNRVGGISAACSEAFRHYCPVLSAITGMCYWWGWVPTCGLTALLSASAIKQWYFPGLPVEAVACSIVALFTAVNLAGVKWVARLAVPIATASASLAFLSSLIPILSGNVDWRQATDFTLTTPFPGWFGDLTSLMAGLYLIGFAAPAFEAATCHVGETIDPNRNIPRAMLVSAAMAGIYFIVLPVVWLGTLGSESLSQDLAVVLGPTYTPLVGSFGKAAAIWFIMLNMFHGTLQPLAGAARTLSQLSEDGLLPRFLSLRSSTDCPWAATVLTAGVSIVFLLMGDPIWLIAAANFTYLIGICMPNVAVWLLRRDMPDAERPYRAPRGTIVLGLVAATIWLTTAILGFQQFGLPTVVFGLLLAYSGAALYAWRVIEDRGHSGSWKIGSSLHLKLTGAMLLVLFLDGAGYFLAIDSLPTRNNSLATALEDIFVAVALLSISVGLILPGMITNSAREISDAANKLTSGTLRDFAAAISALGRGDLDFAQAAVNIAPVRIHSRDELGAMAASFNVLQDVVKEAAHGLDDAREKLRSARIELADRHAEIERLAHHDALTSLPNRNLLAEHLGRAMARVKRGQNVALLFLDLDNFKLINDTLGHTSGDELLKIIAGRLLAAVRETDTVARLGGDEFAILLIDANLPNGAANVSQRIIELVQQPVMIGTKSISCGVSIGIAIAPDDASNPADLLRYADLALYAAKAEQRGTYRFFQLEMDRKVRARTVLENELRCAIENGELEVHYQPILDVKTKSLISAEALVRWRHPTRGLVPPMEFIPVAEDTGMILNIGLHVLFSACRDAASWPSHVSVAVNISALELVNPDLVRNIQAAIQSAGIESSRLEIEVTESSLMKDVAASIKTLNEIVELGVKISMDDFGTGYSSLGALRSFRFAKIKIDRAFVRDLDNSEEARAILATIVSLAKLLGMETTAEGVETVEQFKIVKKHGCSQVQGFLFYKPLPLDQLQAVLHDKICSFTTAA